MLINSISASARRLKHSLPVRSTFLQTLWTTGSYRVMWAQLKEWIDRSRKTGVRMKVTCLVKLNTVIFFLCPSPCHVIISYVDVVQFGVVSSFIMIQPFYNLSFSLSLSLSLSLSSYRYPYHWVSEEPQLLMYTCTYHVSLCYEYKWRCFWPNSYVAVADIRDYNCCNLQVTVVLEVYSSPTSQC